MSFTDPWLLSAMTRARQAELRGERGMALTRRVPGPSPHGVNAGSGEPLTLPSPPSPSIGRGAGGEGRHRPLPPPPAATFAAVCLATARAYISRGLAYTIDAVRWPLWPLLYFSVLLIAYRVSGRAVVDGVPVEGFLLVGTLGMVMWSSNLWASGYAIEMERQEGTIASLLLTPANRGAVVLGYAIGSYVVLIIPTTLVLTVLSLLVGVRFQIADPLAVLASAVTLVVGAVAIGYALAGAFVLSRRANLLANFFQSPIYLLSGMAVPVSALPEPLQLFAAVFPISAGMDALRQSLLAGATLPMVAGDIGRLLMLAAALLLIGSLLLRRVEHVAKRGAELLYE